MVAQEVKGVVARTAGASVAVEWMAEVVGPEGDNVEAPEGGMAKARTARCACSRRGPPSELHHDIKQRGGERAQAAVQAQASQTSSQDG